VDSFSAGIRHLLHVEKRFLYMESPQKKVWRTLTPIGRVQEHKRGRLERNNPAARRHMHNGKYPGGQVRGGCAPITIPRPGSFYNKMLPKSTQGRQIQPI
jgi:hypothetical protein